MKVLTRALLIILCVALAAATCGIYLNTTQNIHDHTVRYLIRWPGLRDVREWSLLAVLAWCVIFVKSEPTFARIGLIAALLALVMMLMPFRNF